MIVLSVVVEHRVHGGSPRVVAGGGFAVDAADVARLLPLLHEHINVLGYSFSIPESVTRGELRPLRDPDDGFRCG